MAKVDRQLMLRDYIELELQAASNCRCNAAQWLGIADREEDSSKLRCIAIVRAAANTMDAQEHEAQAEMLKEVL